MHPRLQGRFPAGQGGLRGRNYTTVIRLEGVVMPPPMPHHPGYGPAPSSAQVVWLLDRELAFHLISEHADPLAVCRDAADNREQHEYEHTGPGTIRDHDPGLLARHADKIEYVLEDAERP